MNDDARRHGTMQDHAAFRAGGHDFQTDIEVMAESRLVGTILETVMLATNMRFTAIARVTADRWVACRTVDEINFGLAEGDEIEIRSTFCQSVRETSNNVLFSDVAHDDIYRDHPIAVQFGIVSYASIPIHRTDGSFFGTLCAIDTEPRDVKDPRVVAMLEMFADIIGRSLEAEERLEAQERLIEREQELARIQDEFVAVLGHDLRNPVSALGAGLRQLARESSTDRARMLYPLMRASLYRMNELIDNIMLHAKARLGGGIGVSPKADAALAEAITQIVEEIRMASPNQAIELDLGLDEPVTCDAPRVAQAVSNLLSNAIRHGTAGAPITVRGAISERELELSVTNRGEAVPDEMIQKLFQPFQRGLAAKGEGLGLGLYIASSIASAHGGHLDMTCVDGATTVTLKLPPVSAPA